VRTLEASFAARMASKDFAPIRLLELLVPQGTLRYALYATGITFGGKSFVATSGAWTEQQESLSPEAPTPSVILQNVDEVVGPILDLLTSGKDPRGSKARLLLTDATAAAVSPTVDGTWLEETYFIEGCQVIEEPPRAVSLVLGVWAAVAVKVPWRLVGVSLCPFIYKGIHCGFTVLPDGSGLSDCRKTIDECARHFPGLPLRTGQFLSRDVLPRTVEV
jgi:hypothetical protein